MITAHGVYLGKELQGSSNVGSMLSKFMLDNGLKYIYLHCLEDGKRVTIKPGCEISVD